MNRHVAGRLITVIVIAISLGGFAGRNVSADQVEELGSPQQSQKNMEQKAAEFGKKIDELELKIKTAKEDVKIDLSRQVHELRKKQNDVQKMLKEMKIASGNAWQDAKSGAQSAIDDLQKAYESARKRFGNTTE
jgi:uncharacterized protein HemX